MIAPPDTIEELDKLVASRGWDPTALKVERVWTRRPRQVAPPPWHEFAVEARRQGFTFECIGDYIGLDGSTISSTLKRWA